MGIENELLSASIYGVSMADFKYPTTLSNFQGNMDTQDPQIFVYGFFERLRLLKATDVIMCRVFTTSLTGKV